MTPRGLAKFEAAAYIGCGATTFLKMVSDGSMPTPRLIGTKRVWDTVELDEKFEDLPRHGGDQSDEWDQD